jgi:pyruvate dehydrogenase E1 component beta subunit
MAEATLTYLRAIRDTLVEEMRRDSRIFLLGEDIKLNVWAVTRHIVDEFPGRVIHAPLSESGFTGVGVGAALAGLRPIVEIMYADFVLLAADSLGNQAAKYRYMCGGGAFKVPAVFRIAGGGSTRGAGCHHGQSLEATLMHYPGLKIVYPATPRDAKGLLLSAIRDDNPVVFHEHKLLYRVEGPVPDGGDTIPIGKADVKRAGSDITIVSYAWMLHKALEAAGTLASSGIEAEVVDLRSLRPLDMETILRSIEKTGRLLTVEEGTKMGGVGAEIAACVAEDGLQFLEAPVGRLAAAEWIIPSSTYGDQLGLPDAAAIVEAAKRLVAY